MPLQGSGGDTQVDLSSTRKCGSDQHLSQTAVTQKYAKVKFKITVK